MRHRRGALFAVLMLMIGAPVLFTAGGCTGNANPPPLGVDIDVPAEMHDRMHVPVGQAVTYASNPPASGPHWSGGTLDPFTLAPAPDEFYPNSAVTKVRPEQWVHNLEHGHIVILYDCKGDCPEGLKANLRSLISEVPLSKFGTHKLLITPYDGLPYQITAVAWRVQMNLAEFDEQKLLDFFEQHVDMGPEDIP